MSATDKKVRILCVEDDPQLRTFLLAQLKARGFQAQAVSDGAQAIDLAAIFQASRDHGLQPENISLKRDRLVFKYSF